MDTSMIATAIWFSCLTAALCMLAAVFVFRGVAGILKFGARIVINALAIVSVYLSSTSTAREALGFNGLVLVFAGAAIGCLSRFKSSRPSSDAAPFGKLGKQSQPVSFAGSADCLIHPSESHCQRLNGRRDCDGR
jgi:hypothetical protein